MIDFTEQQLERYSRNILLKDVGIEGQSKILEAKVLLIGAGGLGSPIGLYLAAAGVGTIGLVDSDVVDVTNLQRQIAHSTADLNKAKVESAAEKMRAINPDVTVSTIHEFVRADNIADIISPYDFIIDGTDNFAAKFLINDACVLHNKPYSHGGILRFDGQTMTVLPNQSACYRCVFKAPPPPGAVPSCAQAGVLGSIAGMLGTIQATEALKWIIGAGDLLTDTLLTFNALTMDFRKVKVRRQSGCAVCGTSPSITTLHDEQQQVCDLKSGAQAQ